MRNDTPLIIAGIGGSGTRGLAALVKAHGVYMGNCFNWAHDNLWFAYWTLDLNPFDSGDLVASRLQSFLRRMRSPESWDAAYVEGVEAHCRELARKGIDVPARPNLKHAYASLCSAPLPEESVPEGTWGWKIPYCYLYAESIFKLLPRARMLFLLRHPLDLAFSSNANQLTRYGSWLGDPGWEVSPRWQLKFCLKAFAHVRQLASRYAVHTIRFEDLVQKRAAACREIGEILGLQLDPQHAERCLVTPASIGRYREHELGIFDAEDLQSIQQFGYTV